MLGKYERRHFDNDQKIWMGTYLNLTNILHWHSECELIRIVKGNDQIKIEGSLFFAGEGDCLFCCAEELHYITGEKDSIIEVIIFHTDLLKKVTLKYRPVSPLLSNPQTIQKGFEKIRSLSTGKPRFFCETIENCATEMLLDIYNNNDLCERQSTKEKSKQIIAEINKNFTTITFEGIVKFSGYSPSHFSKMFKKLSGKNFSDYLNFLKIEHAVSLLQGDNDLSVTQICSQCGFLTIRNFNRVFKQITGFTPGTLPKGFATNFNIGIYDDEYFDPTNKNSTLIKH